MRLRAPINANVIGCFHHYVLISTNQNEFFYIGSCVSNKCILNISEQSNVADSIQYSVELCGEVIGPRCFPFSLPFSIRSIASESFPVKIVKVSGLRNEILFLDYLAMACDS